MGIISDAIDSLETWCENLFKDGIKSQFDNIAGLLTDTFSTTTGDGGLVQTFLVGHPASFTGNPDGTGTKIWTTIETLCNSVVVPIGGFILTIILLNDLIQTVIKGNNFKDFDDSIFIKWIIKALCGVLLVSNVFYIASGIFSFGTNVCANGLSTMFGTGDYLGTDLELQKSALSGLELGELITVWFISLIVHLGIAEQIHVYRRTNVVKSEKFSEIIQRAMNAYLNGMLTNEQVIEELMKLAKDIAAASKEGQELGLTADELAFYDALTKPQAVKDFYENAELIAITKELTETLRKNRTIDWQKKDSARARMRMMIKKLLKTHRYPPEGMEDAVQTVMLQCELWVDNSMGV